MQICLFRIENPDNTNSRKSKFQQQAPPFSYLNNNISGTVNFIFDCSIFNPNTYILEYLNINQLILLQMYVLLFNLTTFYSFI